MTEGHSGMTVTDAEVEAAINAARQKRAELIAKPLARVWPDIIHAALEAAAKVPWQPIETAPKDGMLILATWEGSWSSYPYIKVVYFDAGYWHYAYDGDGPSAPPTHWMPLPAPPSPSNGERDNG